MNDNQPYGSLANSKKELQFIRLLAFLGAAFGCALAVELGNADPDIDKGLAVMFGLLGGSIAGALAAKALSVALQMAIAAIIVLYYAIRVFNLLELMFG